MERERPCFNAARCGNHRHAAFAGASRQALRAAVALAIGIGFDQPAGAQVVINTPQGTAQNLDVLPNPGNLNTADVAANVDGGSNPAIVGTARPWSVTVESGVSVTGSSIGVNLLNGGGGAVVNGGTIQGSTGVQLVSGGSITDQAGSRIVGTTFAAITAGATTTIVNAGFITNTNPNPLTSVGAINMVSGSITNLPGGVISSAVISAITATGATLTNAGTITATGANGGAVVAMGGNGTFVNSGTIAGTGGAAMSLFGTNFTLVNSGALSGIGAPALRLGVSVPSPNTTTLINSGTIAATGGVAAQFGNGTNTVVLQPGSTIVGQLVGGTGSNTALVQGATVSGPAGFVNFNVVNSTGTMAPGAAGTPDVLPIAGGNYNQQSGGTLSIVVTASAASKLIVSGSATLAGTLALQAAPGLYLIGTKYPILTAGGGISDTFAQTTGATISPLLTLAPTYLSDEVDLTVQLAGGPAGTPGTFAGFAATGNQQSIGAALDVVSQNPPSAFVPVLGAVTALSTVAQIQNAFDQIGGSAQGYAGLASSTIGSSLAVSSTVGQLVFATHAASSGAAAAQRPSANRVQLASLDHAALAQGPAPMPFVATSPWSAWLSGFGIFGGIAGNGNAAGLNYSTGGTVFGADYRLDPSLLLGAFAGHAGTDTSVSGLSATGQLHVWRLRQLDVRADVCRRHAGLNIQRRHAAPYDRVPGVRRDDRSGEHARKSVPNIA